MTTREKIIEKITHEGPISFHDFMDLALYCPGTGFYTSSREKIGKHGDYYTSPCLGNIFGEMIGKQLEEMWVLLNKQPFHIIEYGAGNAALCKDILCYLQRNKMMYDELRYYIIEKNPAANAKRMIASTVFNEKVSWIGSIKDIGIVNGCVLSNELLDNFAVHQVLMQDELMEVFVDFDGSFIEALKPAAPCLQNYFAQLGINLPKGNRAEINLAAEEWLNEIAGSLSSGFIITIDYGYAAAELYQRKQGTLLCYYKHSISEDPYSNVGEQDITCHVNFSALLQFGLKQGLHCCGFTNQSNFLRSLGITSYLRKLEEMNNDATQDIASLFILLTQLGQKIKVLIQQKGIKKSMLSGMQFPLQLQ